MPTIVLLSGTTCSGKTTLSQTLQEKLSSVGHKFLHIESDRILPRLPGDWNSEDGSTSAALSSALLQSVCAFADAGFDLIVDGLLPYEDTEQASKDGQKRQSPCVWSPWPSLLD